MRNYIGKKIKQVSSSPQILSASYLSISNPLFLLSILKEFESHFKQNRSFRGQKMLQATKYVPKSADFRENWE